MAEAYTPCPNCHRPSWGHVAALIDDAREAGREEVILEALTNGNVLATESVMAIHAALDGRPKARAGR